MRILFAALVILHGALHLPGFLKAYSILPVPSLAGHISKPFGLLWLLAGVLLVVSGLFYGFRFSNWWIPGSAGVLLSVILISTLWGEARWGILPNLVILFGLGLWYTGFRFKEEYIRDVRQSQLQLGTREIIEDRVLSTVDLTGLPDPVKNYIIRSGFLGKPRIHSFKAISRGVIRKNEAAGWIRLSVEQYNFTEPLTRLFYMSGFMKGLPVTGYHRFKDGHAAMDVRLASLFKVEYRDGREMDIAETVTFFNDLCVFAPGALPFKTIQWEVVDSSTVRAAFTDNGITIRAALRFNEHNELVDFESDDRYYNQEDQTMIKIKWTTPLRDYKTYRGFRLASKAEAVWHFPQAPLVYARFDLEDMIYNPEH